MTDPIENHRKIEAYYIHLTHVTECGCLSIQRSQNISEDGATLTEAVLLV